MAPWGHTAPGFKGPPGRLPQGGTANIADGMLAGDCLIGLVAYGGGFAALAHCSRRRPVAA